MKNKILTTVIVILTLTGISSSQAWPWSKTIQEQFTSSIGDGLNKNKQEIFNHFHPIGTAKSIKLHAVDIKWKNDVDTENSKDIQSVTFRYTIYWEGPLTSDGFTKVEAVYDPESDRVISSKILATNGVTNEDVGHGVGAFIGGFIEGAAEGAAEGAVENAQQSQ